MKKFKKFLSVVLVVTFISTVFTVNVFARSVFTDIQEHWAKNNIYDLASQNIIDGFPDGSFRPQDTVTVEQFLKTVVMAMGERVEPDPDNWSKPYIAKAKENNLIDSIDNFKGLSWNAFITRENMAEIIMRAYEGDITLLATKDQIKASIEDLDDITGELRSAVYDCYGLGIICGYPNGDFKPQGVLTRAEATTVILRYLEEGERLPYEAPKVYKEFDEVMEKFSDRIRLEDGKINSDGSFTFAYGKSKYRTTKEQSQLIQEVVTKIMPMLPSERDMIRVWYADLNGTSQYLLISVQEGWQTIAARTCYVEIPLNPKHEHWNDEIGHFDFGLYIHIPPYFGEDDKYMDKVEIKDTEGGNYIAKYDNRYYGVCKAFLNIVLEDNANSFYEYAIANTHNRDWYMNLMKTGCVEKKTFGNYTCHTIFDNGTMYFFKQK